MKIGLTGGIGSGKSYVCRYLRQHGIEVFDCDTAAKQLMRTSPTLRQQLTELIGPETYTDEGLLNKAVVAQFLLALPANAKAIDAIVHPAVFDAFIESGLTWMESAILYESGAYKLVDKVVAVVAPKEVRIRRVMQRDNISREKALDWMNRQMNQDEVARKADFVVINDGEKDIDNQIIKILEQCNKQF
jgi:dephospho-CoA kinase